MTKLALVLVALAACKGSEPAPSVTGEARPANGQERGDCGPSNTCDPGLSCLSNLCVRPPPADCQAVADYMTTLELGNYAEPEARQPLIVKYKGACVAAKISKDQGECVTKAKEQFSAWRCAPAMFPEAVAQGKAACAPAIANLRTIFKQSLGATTPPAPGDLDQTEIILEAMRASCEEDGWPASLLQCMQTVGTDAKQLMVCNNQMPPEVQQRLAERVSKAATEAQQRQQGVPGGMGVQPPPPPPPPAR